MLHPSSHWHLNYIILTITRYIKVLSSHPPSSQPSAPILLPSPTSHSQSMPIHQKGHYPWQQLQYINQFLLTGLTKCCVRLNACSKCGQLAISSSQCRWTVSPLRASWQHGPRGLHFTCLILKTYHQKRGKKLWRPPWKLLRRKGWFQSLSVKWRDLVVVRLCYDFRQLRQSSTVVVSKVQSQMSLEECKLGNVAGYT